MENWAKTNEFGNTIQWMEPTMKNLLLLSILLFSVLGCKNDPPLNIETEKEPKLLSFSRSQFQELFVSNEVKGAFLLYDLKNDTTVVFNEPRTKIGYIPASTFKIINSLIALETAVIKDEDETIKWDGKERFAKIWNQDHNLRSGIKYSVVWFYQELARRIGEERMQYYIDSVGYGNQDIRGGIDLFWLNGNIRITMQQQVEFLKKLYKNDLPFSQRSMDIVKDIMIHTKTEDYILRAKTGWAARIEPNIGWFVGYLERKDNVYFFVNNIDINNNEDLKARKKITMQILKKLNLIRPNQ